MTLFHSRIKYHRSEDFFGGLSLENSGKAWGAKFSLQAPLSRTLKAHAALSWVEDGHPQDEFDILAFSIIRPDGSRDDFYENWSQPTHTGPEWIMRLSLDWSLARHQNLVATLSAACDMTAAYNKGASIEQHRTPTMLDLTYNRPGFFPERDRFTLRVTNLFNFRSTHPDVYGPVGTELRRVTLSCQLKFRCASGSIVVTGRWAVSGNYQSGGEGAEWAIRLILSSSPLHLNQRWLKSTNGDPAAQPQL